MQKVRSNSNPTGFQNLRDVTVLWHGWLKKLGRFSKRWRRRYFVFVSIAGGRKELRHYDTYRDVSALLVSTPKGVISMTDATGICCFLPTSPHATSDSAASGKKATKFTRSDGNDAGLDAHDQRFAVVTPLHVSLLAFHNGAEWGAASESQQGLSLLAALSAFYPAIEMLHSGWMTKKRERTGHSPKSIISYWKRHFFVFLASGDLLYFRDESLNELQGRVDVRHAPTVRVTGERVIEEKKKESLFKFASKLSALERQACLVWIATPPSKMFVLKLQDESESASGSSSTSSSSSKRMELSPTAKKWLSLLLKGHAETKYTQLEQCAASGKYENTPEIISAIRAGIPDELRGQLWRGFSGAIDVQRRAETKQSIRRASKSASIRQQQSKRMTMSPSSLPTLFEEFAAPIDPETSRSAETEMLFARLSALALKEAQHALVHGTDLSLPARLERAESDASVTFDRESELTDRESFMLLPRRAIDGDDDTEDDESVDSKSGSTSSRNTLKQLVKTRLGDYVYPSDAPSAEWELTARRRLLIATSRFNPFSHPCPWRVSCLLLAYLEEESAFWVINSVIDVVLPGYFHGYRPALQIDVSAFQAVLESRVPALWSHVKALAYPVDRLVEKWFLSIFTSSSIPLPTVLRIWDAFFSQGLRILFGVGVALFLLAEEKLFHATTSAEVDECFRATETSCIDANALFALVFKDDLHISWLAGDQLEKLRLTHRQRVLEIVSQNVEHFNDKLSVLSQVEDVCTRCSLIAERLLYGAKRSPAAQHDPVFDAESDVDALDDDDGMRSALRLVLAQLKSLADGASRLTTELSVRQSKWLALSSQLKACPVGKLPSPDLQSWLSQVREGKISGAGHDAASDASASSNQRAYVSATHMIESSDLFFECSDGVASDVGATSLMRAREDLKPSHLFLSEVFMYSVVSAVKALCAARLEALSASYRFLWHAGRWLESPVEYPPPPRDDERAQNARRLQRSHTNVSFAPIGNHRKPRTRDDSDLTRHTIVEDPRARRESFRTTAKPKSHSGIAFTLEDAIDEDASQLLSPALTTRFDLRGGPSPAAAATPLVLNVSSDPWLSASSASASLAAPSSKRALDELARQHRESSELFTLAYTKCMACFSKYIRLENRSRDWALRERAFVLEDDLQQELKDMERAILGSQWIDRF